ncbi:MAG: fructosamine kinase family protein [Spirochaetota bacterium]
MDAEQANLIFQHMQESFPELPTVEKVSFHSQSLFPIYRASTSDGKEYAIKEINSRQMAEVESNALQYFYEKGCSFPRCYGYWGSETGNFLVMDFIYEAGKISKPRNLLKTLLGMYQYKGAKWGWPTDTFIGSILHKNQEWDSFTEFWWLGRIEPLVQQAIEKGYLDANQAKQVKKIVTGLSEKWQLDAVKPCLIHGDLWTGNVLQDKSGNIFLIDPSICYGHPEQDIGMTRMFGGFPTSGWLQPLQKELALPEDMEERLPFWQLYPVLVHILLFGGSYVGSLNSIILRYS